MTPVIEVHRAEDGVWEAAMRHVLTAEDLETVALDGLPTVQATVRIGEALRALTVYLEDDEDGWVTWEQAFGVDG
jgi:hypothetical protein